MSFVLAEAVVELKAPGATLDHDLSHAEHRLKETEHHMDEVREHGESMFKALFEFETLKIGIDKLKELMTEAGKEEEAMLRLRGAFRATGQDVVESMNAVKELNEVLEKHANITVEESMRAERYAIAMGHTGEELKNVLTTALGLSNVMGTDLQSAVESVTHAEQGRWMQLQRSLPELRNANTEEEKRAVLMKYAKIGLEEQKEVMDGYSARIRANGIAFENLGKSVGRGMIELTTFGGSVNHLVNALEYLTSGTARYDTFTDHLTLGMLNTERQYDAAIISVLKFKDALSGTVDMWQTVDAKGVTTMHYGNKKLEQAERDLRQVEDAVKDSERRLEEDNKKVKEHDAKSDEKLTVEKIKNLNKLKQANSDTFMKIEDIWKDAQKRANAQHDGVIKQIEDEITARKRLIQVKLGEESAGKGGRGGKGRGGGLASAQHPELGGDDNDGEGGGGESSDGGRTVPSKPAAVKPKLKPLVHEKLDYSSQDGWWSNDEWRRQQVTDWQSKNDAGQAHMYNEHGNRIHEDAQRQSRQDTKWRAPGVDDKGKMIGKTPNDPMHTQGALDAVILDNLIKIAQNTALIGGLAPG